MEFGIKIDTDSLSYVSSAPPGQEGKLLRDSVLEDPREYLRYLNAKKRLLASPDSVEDSLRYGAWKREKVGATKACFVGK